MKTREDIMRYLDKMHGVEYDAGEVIYLLDGCVAEDLTHEIGEWRLHLDEDTDDYFETIKIK